MKAKPCQAKGNGTGTAPKIQSVQRPCGLREKVLQVGKGEVEAQLALGRLEVGGVLRCAGPEPFEVVIGGHFLHAPLRRSRPVRVAGEYQNVHRKNQERQVGLTAVKACSSVPGYSEEILLLSEEDILGLDLSRRHVVSKLMTG